MTDEYFAELFEKVINSIDVGPDSSLSILEKIAKKPNASNESIDIFIKLRDSLGNIRLILKYLNFDLEVTRRERDKLRTIVEDREP